MGCGTLPITHLKKDMDKNKPLNCHWHLEKNIGDTLTPILVEFFTCKKVKWVSRNSTGKLLGVGSIMKALRVGDTVWGTGIMRETDIFNYASKCKFLAVRGKLTEKILGVNCGVYGDPALLLPLLYQSKAVLLSNEKN